jgi:hypothetical protein
MDQDALRNGLLFGGYINEIAAGQLDMTPQIDLKGVARHELDAAVEALVSEELVLPWETGKGIETAIDCGVGQFLPALPALTITAKGKKALAGMKGSVQLGILDRFGVVINIGSGHAELHQTNIDVSVQSFQSAVTQRIENSTVTEAEKAEAKSRLRAFIEHPLVNTILGAALGALMK